MVLRNPGDERLLNMEMLSAGTVVAVASEISRKEVFFFSDIINRQTKRYILFIYKVFTLPVIRGVVTVELNMSSVGNPSEPAGARYKNQDRFLFLFLSIVSLMSIVNNTKWDPIYFYQLICY